MSKQNTKFRREVIKKNPTDEEVNFLNAIASGAVHRTGIFPPRVV